MIDYTLSFKTWTRKLDSYSLSPIHRTSGEARPSFFWGGGGGEANSEGVRPSRGGNFEI